MEKLILFNSEARERLKVGVDTIANSVKATLGPKGRNVIIGGGYRKPTITKDGVTVAKEVELKDAVENMGAQMVKEVASKTADVAGDGTTTATVLAQAIVTSGLKNVAAGANPIDLKRGIDKAVTAVSTHLLNISKKVGEDYEKIKQIGTISANNDPIIGGLIAEAMEKVGKEGVITMEDSKSTETYVEVVEGMQFDRGYLSPHFITNQEKMTVELEDPYILIYDKQISTMTGVLPILEKVAQSGRPLLIVSDGLEGEALATLVVNKLRGSIKVAAIKAPSFGETRKAILEDIAILTGGQVIAEEKGMRIEDAGISMLGQASRVEINKDTTTLIGGKGSSKDISTRVNHLKTQIKNASNDYEKGKFKDRLAKLSGGVAVLYVGATTEVEMKEKKDRVEDALYATRAAVEEGIVAGGGTSFIRAIAALDGMQGDNSDQTTGIAIIRRSLEEPLRQIVANAGGEGSVVVQKVAEGKDDFGYNAATGVYESLYKAGVIDPTKVSRVALENASSIAGLLLTTECVLADDPDTNQHQTHPQRL